MIRLAQGTHELESVHARHEDIDENGIDRPPSDFPQALHAILRQAHGEPASFQCSLQRISNKLIVIDHENARHSLYSCTFRLNRRFL
ncbi:hypothetical protein [Breoghania sp.]|uniref:hypothetical protein n=1 Tax=Breoghania sp. TaxID=2065378 RepID=UPI002604C243|nr:hypothetical protein [Breoghania sp.]MDJ0932951.1 hypothetical protein [Breoghania sp.]